MSDQPDNGQRPAVPRTLWIGIGWVFVFYAVAIGIGLLVWKFCF